MQMAICQSATVNRINMPRSLQGTVRNSTLMTGKTRSPTKTQMGSSGYPATFALPWKGMLIPRWVVQMNCGFRVWAQVCKLFQLPMHLCTLLTQLGGWRLLRSFIAVAFTAGRSSYGRISSKSCCSNVSFQWSSCALQEAVHYVRYA